MYYDCFYGVTKFLAWMFFVEKDLRFQTLYLEIYDLRNFEVKTYTAYPLLRKMNGKILMKWTSRYQEQINFDAANLLAIFL